MGALLGEDADVLRRTADDLIEAGLLAEDGGFRADAARLAVLAGLSAAELGALRCRAAEVLHQDGAPARVVAAQLLAARGTARPGWQTDVLRAAGTEAMSAGDAGPAVEHLRRAAELSVGTPREDETGAALAAAEWLVDPAAAARHLPRLARAVRAGRFATGEARPVAEQLVWHGEFTEADTVLRVAGEGCSGVPGAPVASAELAVLRDWFRLVCPDLGPPGDVGPAPAPSALLVRAAGLAAEGAGSAAGSGVTDRVLSGVRVDGPFRATLLLLACLLEEGRLTAADHWPEQLLSEPGQHGVPVRRALLRTVNALLALRRGELDRADRLARAGLFALTPEAWGIAIGAPLGLALRTATETGDTTAARAVLDVPVPVAMLGTPFALPYLYALGAYEAARDRGPEALRHFGRCRELADRWGLTGPGFADWWRRGSARLGRSPRTPAVSGADAPLPELTEAERRVGALAAAGRTNREIAELLLITVSTVEQHLTKVYRKLKVRRREDLPAPLAHFSGEVLNRVEESRV
jgi:DNA-binding CsgD family transcriptional regulator